MFCWKKQENLIARILEGAVDMHNFLWDNKPSNFCSYVNDWRLKDFILIRTKQLLFKSFIFCVCIMHSFIKRIYPFIEKNSFYLSIKPVLRYLYYDIMIHNCF